MSKLNIKDECSSASSHSDRFVVRPREVDNFLTREMAGTWCRLAAGESSTTPLLHGLLALARYADSLVR